MLPLPFMLAVLGSITFWVVYGLVTIVMTMVCFRFCFPNCHTFFMEREALELDNKLDSDGDWKPNDIYINNTNVFWAMLLCFVTWPIISMAMAIAGILYVVYMFFAKLIFPAVASLFRLVDRAIPKVKISKG